MLILVIVQKCNPKLHCITTMISAQKYAAVLKKAIISSQRGYDDFWCKIKAFGRPKQELSKSSNDLF